MFDFWLPPVKQIRNASSSGFVISCAFPVGKVSWILFQEGRSSNLRLRRIVGQATHTITIIPTSSLLEFILHKLWIMLIHMNCVEFNSVGCWVPSLALALTVQLHTKLLVTVRDILQNATGAQSNYCYMRQPTHCSRDKHLAWPHINKKN